MVVGSICCVFFFKQKTAYDMRISDWSSDVCSSDLRLELGEILILLPRLVEADGGDLRLAVERARLVHHQGDGHGAADHQLLPALQHGAVARQDRKSVV